MSAPLCSLANTLAGAAGLGTEGRIAHQLGQHDFVSIYRLRGEFKRYLRRVIRRHRLPAGHLFNHHIRQYSPCRQSSAGRLLVIRNGIQTRLIAAE